MDRASMYEFLSAVDAGSSYDVSFIAFSCFK